ncbi:MAG: amidase family protein, partial [Comamonas sp.]
GSDAGGSVRIPASYAGLTAFKPSFAHIPMWPASPFVEFAHLGPMARNVADLQTIMACIGQSDVRDIASGFVRHSTPWPQRPLRVGVCTQIGHSTPQPEIAQALQQLREDLPRWQPRQQRLEVVDIDLSALDTGEAMWVVWCSRVLEAGLDWTEQELQCVGADMRQQWAQGQSQSPQQLARARQQLRLAAGQLGQVFESIDILLTPTTPTTAPLAGDFVVDDFTDAQALRTSGNWMSATPFSHPWNLTQQPALSIPWGRDQAGMPFGLQVVGTRYSDSLVLDVGKALEAWHKEQTR